MGLGGFACESGLASARRSGSHRVMDPAPPYQKGTKFRRTMTNERPAFTVIRLFPSVNAKRSWKPVANETASGDATLAQAGGSPTQSKPSQKLAPLATGRWAVRVRSLRWGELHGARRNVRFFLELVIGVRSARMVALLWLPGTAFNVWAHSNFTFVFQSLEIRYCEHGGEAFGFD